MIASFLLLALCGAVAFVVLGLGVFFALLKLGVIVREAQRPAHQDFGTYTLSQIPPGSAMASQKRTASR